MNDRARRKPGRAWLSAPALLVLAGAAHAAAATPDAATLLFEEPQLDKTAVNQVLTYAYHRKSADDKLYGASFDDTIRLTLDKGETEQTRTVQVQLFSGAHRRAAGPFENMSGNPVLSLFLEHHIGVLAEAYQANPRYFKTAIRTALRDKAEVKPAEIPFEGRSLPGWRVSIQPFSDDPNKARLNGLDTLRYEFLVARDLPGEIARIEVSAPGKNSPLLDEGISYEAKPD
ncbi:hypothetical protein RNI52_23140 [Labrys neptuniae]|uniref:DUF3108 domain-containing protein n=1 Tax=Labrys neptuniae TaxID=376174 RepID=A0ABV3PPG4_9HYPH|nr:hypothetical protein [Labrys neptuniae]MDT3380237.1 hypothetical protein [Labrys neptuniae]